MAGIEDLRRLALALPAVKETTGADRVSFAVSGKGLAWTYLARPAPRLARQPVAGVMAIRCAIERKELLLQVDPLVFFDDDHYRGYPAVLTRLAGIDEAQLAGLLLEAWRIQAPKALRKAFPPPAFTG